MSEQIHDRKLMQLISRIGQHAEFGDLAAQMTSVSPVINLLDRVARAIKLDDLRKVLVLVGLARQIVPPAAGQPPAVMKRVEDRVSPFCRQQVFQQSLKPRIEVEEVCAFDALKLFQ